MPSTTPHARPREECEQCEGKGRAVVHEGFGGVSALRRCEACAGFGYVETPVSIVDVGDLALWLAEQGKDAREVAYAVTKPHKYRSEWMAMQRAFADEVAETQATDAEYNARYDALRAAPDPW